MNTYTLTTPAPLPETDKIKITYLCDSACFGEDETAEEEAHGLAMEFWSYFGVKPVITIANTPEGVLDRSSSYDILAFDFGGVSTTGAPGLMNSLLRDLLKQAENKPSRLFVMVSKVTAWAMEDILQDVPSPPANLFLSMENAIPYLRCLLLEKGVKFTENLEETKGAGLPAQKGGDNA
jgi:hypothetical protein